MKGASKVKEPRVWRCPFCFSEEAVPFFEIVNGPGDSPHALYAVRCESCHATGPTSTELDSALLLWNTRGDQRKGWCEDSSGVWHYIEKGRALCGKMQIAFSVEVSETPGKGTRCIGCVDWYLRIQEKGK